MSQARDGIIRMIKADPTIITITRKARIADGFGGLMDDPLGATKEYKYRVKISHQKSSVPASSSAPVGLATNLQKMMTIDYKGGPKEGESFTIVDPRLNDFLQTVLYSGVPVTDGGTPVASVEPEASMSESFIIGKIDPLTSGKEIIGYQAALTQAGV